VEPFQTFPERFLQKARSGQYDLIYVSHVFFNSGYVFSDLDQLAAETHDKTVIAVDGYHAFGAVPVDLSRSWGRIFYLAGGYKYTQAGEGACFMTLSQRAAEFKPRQTGWFAGFGSLASTQKSGVAFSDDWWRYAGSTFDPSGWYRFNAVMRLWDYESINVELIHERAQTLQRRFLDRLAERSPSVLPPDSRVRTGKDLERQGNFLTFDLANAGSLQESLMRQKVITDARGTRLRFGFGLYHDLSDTERLLDVLTHLG
jgi:selenocysteine lyase/cysteine desulfurase